MSDDDARDVRETWNRFGHYMQAWADYGARVWERNQNLWAAVDQELGSDRSAMDSVARSTARMMAAGMQNVEDLWAMAVGSPDSARYVKVLPTAFLFFDLREAIGEHTLLDPVDIAVPADVAREARLPATAQIALNGTSTPPDRDAEGVAALLRRLSARLKEGQRSYRLETTNPQEDPGDLVPGVYDGLVYLIDPAMPLANLRIIVEAPEPQPPVVDRDEPPSAEA